MIRNVNGVALVMVLWVTVLLTIMAGSFTLTVRRESSLLSNIKANSQAGAFAEAGVYYAMMMLQLNDAETRWKSNGLVYELQLDEAIIRVRIFEETGKVDINYAEQSTLMKTFQSLDMDEREAESLTEAVMDWRDKDDTQREYGAENDLYAKQDMFYGPRNGAFETIEELQLVLGMNASYYKKLEPMITIYSRSAKINFDKAPEQVLFAIMENEDQVLEKIENRKIPDLIDQLSTDSNSDVNNQESGDQSNVFSVLAEAMLHGDQTEQVFVVINKIQSSSGFEFLRWTKNTNHPSLFVRQ